MGCDIHGIIEQRKPGGQWEACPAQITRLGRDYSVFANLGGVRNYNEEKPVAANRGLPADSCHDTHFASCIFITDGNEERAEKWIQEGHAKWYKKDIFVTNPDYHSHSWCTVGELKEALAQAGDSSHESYLHMTRIMDSTELFGHECRFVFWFDS